jgi:hypothetical protein
MKDEHEKKVIAMYDKSQPNIDDLFETSTINHWAWSSLVLALGLVCWLAIALVNAENQRYAMISGKCQDPVFKGTFDARCMGTVHSREHWWEHLSYALMHPRA